MRLSRSQLQKLDKHELAALAKKLQEIDVANKQRTLESYLDTAHNGQKEFHKAVKWRIRYFLGSNRSGKTTGGTVETLWRVLGTHPFRRNKVPQKGVVIAQDFENHVKNILEPKFEQWAPLGSIVKTERNQNGAWRKVWFSTGSTLDFMSHDQDIKVFEGSDYDFAWFDEPPPQQIFNAVWRGLTDRGGDAYITGTPIVGPWMYQEFMKAQMGDSLRWAITVNIEENARNIGEGDAELGKRRIEEFASMLDDAEKASRLEGKFLQMHGLIFGGWDRKHHLIPCFDWPYEWTIIESIDPHPHKPWAVAWVGQAENGKRILLRSRLIHGVIEEIAEQILAERLEIPIIGGRPARISRTLIDNSASVPLWSKSHTDPTARRVSVREELENMIGHNGGGPRVEVAPKNVSGKISIFRSWLRKYEDRHGMESDFYVFDIPENERFIYEIENYVWDTKRGGVLKGLKDVPLKKDDDILDAVMQIALTYPKEPEDRPEPIRQRMSQAWKV